MKIVFTGGGTGGHFYPIIAVAEELRLIIRERRLLDARFYYLADKPYNSRLLFENEITFKKVEAGKRRRYRSVLNFFDIFKTGWGIVKAIWRLYWIYPDLVFSKGGYVAFPTLAAARFLRIPVMIHESDSRPGRVNAWSGKFARRIAVSFPEAAVNFPAEKTAVIGNPIRRELLQSIKQGAHEFLHLKKGLPTLFVLGGSQGATTINAVLVDILPKLVEHFQIIHQTGEKNLADVKARVSLLLQDNPNAKRYQVFAHLNSDAMKMAAGVATLIITRAGAGAIFETANWGVPSIIIPIPEEVSHDQRLNAFTYARSGAAVVIEQNNLTSSVLLAEINRLIASKELTEKMRASAKSFAKPDAGRLIAEEILKLALKHEE
ncbi:MAG: undecaprenyldiphospho-muramoylpentapeptide beta-N-acetylglucosaminyltransferase [Patescibacteria group bacterium]|nr:undecaprenyldiphospho-muramoylpentapeptide beta-N-acetylglucosaminyltransferase [Patescibacteria group bacterium]